MSRLHLVGIGGVGMSALAECLHRRGAVVSGSDRFWDAGEPVPALDRLRRMGVRLYAQDGSGVGDGAEAVVVSTAIEADNPDVAAATSRNLPVRHRAAVLAEIVNGPGCAAVSGTAGKTTVTGMMAWILQRAGRSPGMVNGAGVRAWQAPDRTGQVLLPAGGPWVVEADESDGSLVRFEPGWAVLTNIARDHFDIPELKALFRRFLDNARVGWIVGGPAAVELGLGEDPDRILLRKGGRCFEVSCPVPALAVPGAHNRENAALAGAWGRAIGLSEAEVTEGLASFPGMDRRLALIGERAGVRVYDDYAHNAAKIAAALRAVKAEAARVLAIWRPHGYTPLKQGLEDIAERAASVLGPDDRFRVLPVFDRGGSAQRGVSADDLVGRLRERGVDAEALPEAEGAMEQALAGVRAGDAVLVMGARDPHLTARAERVLACLENPLAWESES